MTFPYKKLGRLKYGPVVPLRLKGSSRWVLFNAFVDSGADCSVFHSSVAAALGLHLKSGQKKVVTVGDGDPMILYLHSVHVLFAGYSLESPIAFSERLGVGFNLLGRATFFELFQFCFNDRDRILRVTKLK